MNKAHLASRYRLIMGFFLRLTMSLAFWEVILPALGLGAVSRGGRSKRFAGFAADFRQMAIRMGGVLIKVGQLLSSRLDVLPVEITQELAGLQDEVPPEDFAIIRALAELELGGSLESLFESFEGQPMAAASLGQVHRARLRADSPEATEYRDVVVKIQRPFIEALIDVDFSALRRFGSWLQHYPPVRARVNVPALIDELSTSVHGEIDYLAEGRNAERFGVNFRDRPNIHVPRVAWSRTSARVLTLENVYAIKITDYDAITAAGIDRAKVARVLLEAYLQQIFEDQYFHADPHPGNLFVSPVPAAGRRKAGWLLTFVDFGMAGTVAPQLRDGLRDLLVAIGTRNPGKVIAAYKTLGVLLPNADVALLERAEAQLFDRFWGMSMSELRKVSHADMRAFAAEFRQLLYEMPFQLPQNLLLLGRTLAILSGMCTGLDPDFNVWQQLAPYAEGMLAKEGLSDWEGWLDRLGDLAGELFALPGQTSRVLTSLERGELAVQMPQVSRQISRLETAVNRLAGAAVFVGFLLAGVLLYRADDLYLSRAFWLLAGVVLLWTLFLPGGRPPRER